MALSRGRGKRNPTWYTRLEEGRKERDRHKPDWLRNRALLLGEPPSGVTDWAAVNLAWAAFETMVGLCFARVPDGIVREMMPEDANKAVLATSKSAFDFEQMRLRYHARPVMMDVFWAGRGYLMEKMAADVTSATFKFTKDGKEKETEYSKLTNQGFNFQRLHPLSVIPDYNSARADLTDAEWEAYEYFPTKKELRESKYYEISEKILDSLPAVKASPLGQGQFGYRQQQSYDPRSKEDDENSRVCCLEIWDRVKMERIYMPANSDQEIGRNDWPHKLTYNRENRLPRSLLFFNEHPDDQYPIPELTMAAPQLEQYAVLFRTIIRDAVTKWRKWAVLAGSMDKSQISRLIGGPSNSVIEIKNNLVSDPTKLDIQKMILPLADTVVKEDVAAVMGIVKGVVHEIIGAGDFASGGMRNTRSATEAAKLADFLMVRMTNRTENIDSFFREVLITHVLMLQELMVDEASVPIPDERGGRSFRKVDRKGLAGTFAFEVVAGSSQPRNTESAKQEAMQFYQLTLEPIRASGGNIEPMVRWIAPFLHMPQDMVDRIFANHKQALMQVAVAMQAMHAGTKIQPQQFLELVSRAVNTGLSAADMKMLEGIAAQANAAGPAGMAGTNTTDQTLPQ